MIEQEDRRQDTDTIYVVFDRARDNSIYSFS